MADHLTQDPLGAERSNWSDNRADVELFWSADHQHEFGDTPSDCHNGARNSRNKGRVSVRVEETIWRHVWLQYAAAVLLVATLGIVVYRSGIERGSSRITATPQVSLTPARDATAQTKQLQTTKEQQEKIISDLRHELAQGSAELRRLRKSNSRLEAQMTERLDLASRLAGERSDLQRRLDVAQANVNRLEQKLRVSEISSASRRENETEAQLSSLVAELRDRNDTIEKQKELLAHGRDIRELMGARDLYIAEVYDVAGSGTTKKPYGRVFYTKGKSLVFYAYDLDQQNNFKNTSTFQAWGRRGPEVQHAVSLGIFYEDNAANRRWVLRCDDPRTLSQIDAVFVTVEPTGGSQTPSQRKLLFASLKIDPNHP